MTRADAGTRARGFTLVELLVVIGIIAVLISILLPTLARARASSERVNCLSNLRQVYTTFQFYALANRDQAPLGYRLGKSKQFNSMVWSSTSKQYVLFGLIYKAGLMKTPRVFFCPSENNPQSMFATPINPWPPGADGDPTIQGYCGYACRPQVGIPDDLNTAPEFSFPRLYRFRNSAILSDLTATPERVTTRHYRGINVLFGSGAAHWVERQVFDEPLNQCHAIAGVASPAIDAAQDEIWRRLDLQ